MILLNYELVNFPVNNVLIQIKNGAICTLSPCKVAMWPIVTTVITTFMINSRHF